MLTFMYDILGIIYSLVNLVLVAQDEGADEAVVESGGTVPLCGHEAPDQEQALSHG